MEFYSVSNAPVTASNSRIIGAFPTAEASSINSGSVGIKTPKSDGWNMVDMKFYNFKSNMLILATCSGCSPTGFINTPKEFTVENTYYHNISGSYLSLGGLQRDMVHDLDGSFSASFNSNPQSSKNLLYSFSHIKNEVGCSVADVPSLWSNAISCNMSVIFK